MTDDNDETYRVGPGRPPKHTRFRPGQSGNPGGRPKRETSLEEAFARELMKIIKVTEGGKERRLTKLQMIAKVATNSSIKGDFKFTSLIMQLMAGRKENSITAGDSFPQLDGEMIKRIKARLKREERED